MSSNQLAVILPAHEIEGLGPTLVSLSQQDLAHLVIVVLNGQAVTGREGLQASWPDVVFLTTDQLGISKALNTGISEALSRGYPYLARADCSCNYRKDWLRQSLAALEANEGWSLVWSDRSFAPLSSVPYQAFEEVADLVYRLFYGNPVKHPTLVMRTRIFEELATWYDSVYDGCEDFELWCRLARLGYRFGRSPTQTLQSQSEDWALAQAKIQARLPVHLQVVEAHRRALGLSRGVIKANKERYSEVKG